MAESKVIIRRKRTERFIGVEKAARELGVTTLHLSRCLHGKRELAREKMRRIRIVDVKGGDDGES